MSTHVPDHLTCPYSRPSLRADVYPLGRIAEATLDQGWRAARNRLGSLPPHLIAVARGKAFYRLRAAVNHCRRCLNAELGYDVDDPWLGRLGTPDDHVYAWAAVDEGDAPDFAFGACVFRPLDGTLKGWKLVWVWLHPYLRGHGVLRAAWPAFRSAYGPFQVQRPCSPAMLRFLHAQGQCPRHGDRLQCLCGLEQYRVRFDYQGVTR